MNRVKNLTIIVFFVMAILGNGSSLASSCCPGTRVFKPSGEKAGLKDAREAMDKKQPYQAMMICDRLLADSPDSEETIVAANLIVRSIKGMGENEEWLNRAEEEYKKIVRRNFPKGTHEVDKSFLKVEQLFEEKNFQAARELLKKVIDKHTGTIQEARALNRIGISYYYENLDSQAVKEFQKVIDLFTDTKQALAAKRWIAEAHLRRKKYDQSINQNREVITDHLRYATLTPWTFCLDFLIEEVEKSKVKCFVEEYQNIIDSREKLLRETFAFLTEGRYRSAKTKIREMLEKTDNSRRQAAWAQWLIAKNYHTQRQYEEAIREYRKFVEDYPDSNFTWQAIMETGRCFYFNKDYEEAVEEFQKIIDNCRPSGLVDTAKQNVKDIKVLLDLHRRKDE